MVPTNPLELPEICFHVAEYLERCNLARCVLVSRSWRQSFTPFLWQEVVVKRTNQPSPDDLRRHRNLVTTLHINRTQVASYNLHFPKLLTLRSQEGHGDPTTVIELNPSLVSVDMSFLDFKPRFWKALSTRLPHLVDLTLDGYCITRKTALNFWRACVQVESLELQCGTIDSGTESFVTHIFPRMRRLKLHGFKGLKADDQLALIKQCPRLQDLLWHNKTWLASTMSQRFAEYAAARTWPELQRVDLDVAFTDESTAVLLHNMEYASKVVIRSYHFGHQSIQASGRHLGCLQEVRLSGCEGSSVSLARFMCLCPVLKIFSVRERVIEAKDIIEGGAWVCLDMRELHVEIGVHSSEQGLQALIFERLGKLDRLENLSIGAGYHRLLLVQSAESSQQTSIMHALDFRLERGVTSLATLRRLECLDIHGTGQLLGEKEIEWMMTTWRSLERVRGNLNMDPDTDRALMALLRAGGIKHE